MLEITLGPIRFAVQHRVRSGPTLRVHEAETGRERLRFDCFEVDAHLHVDPAGANRVESIPQRQDAIDWTLAEARRDLADWLRRAGFELAEALDARSLEHALTRVEEAMRHPPLDLDSVDPDTLRCRTGEKWQVYADDIIPAWVADMDFPVAEPIRRRLRRALEVSDLGYPLHPRPTGIPELFVERMERRFGWLPDVRRLELLSDVVQGIYVALEAYSERGQGVVVQTPIYPPFLQAVREMGRALVENRLVAGKDGYEIDFDALRTDVERDTRILLLSHPHNPTGRVFRREELAALAEIVLERDLIVVSDEIHADLVFPGQRHIPFASLGPEVEARTVTLTSATKAFSIAGLRLGVGAFGSADLRKRFLEVPRHIRGGLGGFGIEATRAAWSHGQPWLDAVLQYLEGNRDLVTRFVRERLPGVVHHPPEATYLAWLDCRALRLELSPYDFFLERAKVALSDGRHFGAAGEGFVRLNFATPRALLDEIFERLARAVAT
jgi:cystathionine beta-lyase